MFPLTLVLCPVDFSDLSRHALDHAAALARLDGAGITVLYVHCMAVPVPAFDYSGMGRPLPLTDAERTDILQSLADFVADYRASGLAIETLSEEDLSVSPAIVRVAADERADLIVLGTHGRSGFNRLVLGSVANKVVKTAGCPVLVIPPRANETAPVAYRRLVCGVDFSPASARALQAAVSFASKHEARLTVIHVVDLPADAPPYRRREFADYRASRFTEARASLDAAIGGLGAACAIDELIVVGKPSAEILRVAAEQQADLLVIGAHGTGAIDLLAFGTTAHRVMRQAPCPVLTLRAS